MITVIPRAPSQDSLSVPRPLHITKRTIEYTMKLVHYIQHALLSTFCIVLITQGITQLNKIQNTSQQIYVHILVLIVRSTPHQGYTWRDHIIHITTCHEQ